MGRFFLLTVRWLIKFVTVEHVPVRMAINLSKYIQRVLDVYKQVGFIIRTILMDGEFEKIRPLLTTLECKTTATNEHISKAEQTIRTLKELTRFLLAMLPFSYVQR